MYGAYFALITVVGTRIAVAVSGCATKRVDPLAPCGVEIRASREALIQLEDNHPMREGPEGPCSFEVAAGRVEQRQRGRLLDAWGEQVATQGPLGHQPV